MQRVFALLVAFALLLPYPAFALKPPEVKQSTGLEELDQALHDSDDPLRAAAAGGVEENVLDRRQFLQTAAGGALTVAVPGLAEGQGTIPSVVPENLGVPPSGLPTELLRQKEVRLVQEVGEEGYHQIDDALAAIRRDPSIRVVVARFEGGWSKESTVLPKGVSLIGGTPTTNWSGDLVVDGGTVANLSIQGKVTLQGGARLLNSVVVGEVDLLGDKNIVRSNQIIADTIVRRSREKVLSSSQGVLRLNTRSSGVVLEGGAAIDVGTAEAPSSENVLEGNLVVFPFTDPKDWRLFLQEKQIDKRDLVEGLMRMRSAALHIRWGRRNQVRYNTLVNWYVTSPPVLLGPWRYSLWPDELSDDTAETRLHGNVLAVVAPILGVETEKAVIQGEGPTIEGGDNLVVGGTPAVLGGTDRHVTDWDFDAVFRGGARLDILKREDAGEFRAGDYKIRPEWLGQQTVGVFRQSRSSDRAGLEEKEGVRRLDPASFKEQFPDQAARVPAHAAALLLVSGPVRIYRPGSLADVVKMLVDAGQQELVGLKISPEPIPSSEREISAPAVLVRDLMLSELAYRPRVPVVNYQLGQRFPYTARQLVDIAVVGRLDAAQGVVLTRWRFESQGRQVTVYAVEA